MNTQFLTDEQRALFENQLSQADRRQALRQGAQMAKADLESALPTDIPQDDAPQDVMPQDDMPRPESAETDEAYEQILAENRELRALVRRLLAADKADAARSQLEPETERERTAVKNRLIQKEWTARAGELRDLIRFLPDMAEYIMAHPQFALEPDGLERAYDAVRSGLYRSEDELMDDPEAVKRISADPRVKNAVLTAHLADVYRSGRNVPAFIDGEGGSPAPAPNAKSGMDQARARLEALLR